MVSAAWHDRRFYDDRAGMDWARLKADIPAGVTTAAVVIPQAMAYATIAGLPVQVGLYTAIVPLLVYALVGTSRPLSVSTTSTIAALTAVAVAAAAPETTADAIQAVTTVAVLTGVILLAAGALKLGFLADFISLPVLAGFKAGTGLLIISGQLGKVLGTEQSGDNFFQKTWSAMTHLPDAHGRTVLLSALTLVLLVAIKRWAPRAFPGALVAVALGIVLSSLLDLDEKGVAVVGSVPAGLPGLELPDLGLLETLLPAAVGIALMSFVESIAAARAFVHHGDPPLKADRELIALGAANAGSGLSQGLPAGGGLSQTAVNDAAGARTPLAGAVTAGVALLTVLFLTGLFEELPQASLGAVVIVAAAGLVDLDSIRALGRIRGSALVFASATVFGVLLLGVLDGVLIGVVLSMLGVVWRLNHPEITVIEGRADNELVARIEGPVYFANVGNVHEQLLELVDSAPVKPRSLVVDLVAIPDADVTTLLRIAAFERDLGTRDIALRFENAGPRLLELAERTPELVDRCERELLEHRQREGEAEPERRQ
jgi:sulfate permease, SulP family